MAGSWNLPAGYALDTLTRRMACVIMSCRGFFQFDRPDGFARAKTGERVEVVKVVVSWVMTADSAASLAIENGRLDLEQLYGCPIRIVERQKMGAFSFALLNPDETGVAVTTKNTLVTVSAVDGRLTANESESA